MEVKPMTFEQGKKLQTIRSRISQSPYFAVKSDVEYSFEERFELAYELAKRILRDIG